jgi:hypothetical protein
MIKLGNLINTVLNEFTLARTKAKFFSTQMAADFKGHELLQHLSIPDYKIGRAEITLHYAVSKVQKSSIKQITSIINKVTENLPVKNSLESAFSLYKNQKELWHKEIAPSIERTFESESIESLSTNEIIRIYRYIVKNHYLQSLLKASISKAKIEESIKSGFADLISNTAGKILQQEIEKVIDKNEEGSEEKKGENINFISKTPNYDMYIIVDSEELKGMNNISSLKLELEEELLDPIILTQKEENDEK